VVVSRLFFDTLPELGPKAGKIRSMTMAISFLEAGSMSRSFKKRDTLSNHFSSLPLFSQW
jgi:hypothetical protein